MRRSSSESGSSASARELATSPEGEAPWFFGVWQPDEVHDPASDSDVLAFVDAPRRAARDGAVVLEPANPSAGMARLRRASTPATACSIPPRSR